jgi:PPOX class probable F420-dependent enzyme
MSFAELSTEQFINLATTKKSGAAVATPVWFALDGDVMYIMTGKAAGKVKRIRNNPAVILGPCDRSGNLLGPTQPATARLLDESEYAHANSLLNRKYGFMKSIFDLMARFNGGLQNRAFIEIRPSA